MAPLKRFSDIINELSMKSDKKLPNLKEPVKGKKGTSKFMRMKIHNAPYTSDYKKAMNASVDSADRKPEKYMKPDGKMGIRMVKTKKEIITKESIDNHPKVKAARKAHAAGTWDGNVDKEGEAVVHINGKPHTVTNKYGQKKQSNPDKFKPFKKKTNEAKTFNYFDSRDAAHAHAKKHGGKVFVNTGKGATKVKGKPVNTHVVIKKEQVEVSEASLTVKDATGGMSASDKKRHADMVARHGAKTKYSGSDVSYHGTDSQIQKALHIHHPDKDDENRSLKYHKSGQHGKDYGSGATHTYKEEVDVDEALNLAQRMKRSRLMKRMKSRIKIGKQRAMRKMANKKTLEKRSMRQARNAIAKKLTRGIAKKELTFARKKEIEKRLEKPALQQRIKRLAKRMFKDVRKKEVERKKG